MATYIAKRVAQLIPVLLGITIVTFLLLRLTGDPAAILLPPGTPPAIMDEFRKQYGLDQPIVVQYVQFVARAIHGDFGNSIRYNEPVLQLYIERLPATLELATAAMAMAI